MLKELGTFGLGGGGSVARSAVSIRSGPRELGLPVGSALESSMDLLKGRKAECPRASRPGPGFPPPPPAPFARPRRQNFAQPGGRQGRIPLPLRTPGLAGFVSTEAERRLEGRGGDGEKVLEGCRGASSGTSCIPLAPAAQDAAATKGRKGLASLLGSHPEPLAAAG